MVHAALRTRSLTRACGAMLGALALAAWLAPARASRVVDLYRVNVPAGTAQAEAQAGMRVVLVRATGHLNAPDDPALAALVVDASQYVRSISPNTDGSVQIAFDGSRIAEQITSGHGSLWDADRPFVIIAFDPPLTGAADNAARQSLESIAALRGLPIALVPLEVTDSAGQQLSDAALLEAAKRLGADALLLGQVDSSGPSGTWHWTLVTAVASQGWNGTFADGINEATDALARVQGGSSSLGVHEADVRVTGVRTLADYAAVERMLSGLPGVQSCGLVTVDGGAATFRVLILGGASSVVSALGHATRLEREGTADAPILYRLQP